MTVEKVKEIINKMIDEKVETAKNLGLMEWTPDVSKEINKTVAEGRILNKISEEETEELSSNLGL